MLALFAQELASGFHVFFTCIDLYMYVRVFRWKQKLPSRMAATIDKGHADTMFQENEGGSDHDSPSSSSSTANGAPPPCVEGGGTSSVDGTNFGVPLWMRLAQGSKGSK